jgi:hypothetical protein
VAAKHADGADDEECLATELVEEEHSRKREDDLKYTSDTRSEECLLRR